MTHAYAERPLDEPEGIVDADEISMILRGRAEQEFDELRPCVYEWMRDDFESAQELARCAIRWNAAAPQDRRMAGADLSDLVEQVRERYIEARLELADSVERAHIEIELQEGVL